jgi:hypothetical protein
MANPPYRKIKFGSRGVSVNEHSDGTQYVRSITPLGGFPNNLCQVLAKRAALHPDRAFLAHVELRCRQTKR